MTNPAWQYEADPEEFSDDPLCDCTGTLVDPMCGLHGDYDPYYSGLKELDEY